MCDTTAAERIVRAHEDLVIAIDALSTALMENEDKLCSGVFFNAAGTTLMISEVAAEQASVIESMRIGAGIEYSRKFMHHYNTSPIVNPNNPKKN